MRINSGWGSSSQPQILPSLQIAKEILETIKELKHIKSVKFPYFYSNTPELFALSSEIIDKIGKMEKVETNFVVTTDNTKKSDTFFSLLEEIKKGSTLLKQKTKDGKPKKLLEFTLVIDEIKTKTNQINNSGLGYDISLKPIIDAINACISKIPNMIVKMGSSPLTSLLMGLRFSFDSELSGFELDQIQSYFIQFNRHITYLMSYLNAKEFTFCPSNGIGKFFSSDQMDEILNSGFLLDRFNSINLKIREGLPYNEIPNQMILLYVIEKVMKLSKLALKKLKVVKFEKYKGRNTVKGNGWGTSSSLFNEKKAKLNLFKELNKRKEAIIKEFKEFIKNENSIRFSWFGKEGNSIIEELEEFDYEKHSKNSNYGYNRNNTSGWNWGSSTSTNYSKGGWRSTDLSSRRSNRRSSSSRLRSKSPTIKRKNSIGSSNSDESGKGKKNDTKEKKDSDSNSKKE